MRVPALTPDFATPQQAQDLPADLEPDANKISQQKNFQAGALDLKQKPLQAGETEGMGTSTQHDNSSEGESDVSLNTTAKTTSGNPVASRRTTRRTVTQLERKRMREKHRRDEFSSSFSSLMAVLIRVDPSFQEELRVRERRRIGSAIAHGKRKQSEMTDDNENLPFSRVELVQSAVASLEFLFSKCQSLQRRLGQISVERSPKDSERSENRETGVLPMDSTPHSHQLETSQAPGNLPTLPSGIKNCTGTFSPTPSLADLVSFGRPQATTFPSALTARTEAAENAAALIALSAQSQELLLNRNTMIPQTGDGSTTFPSIPGNYNNLNHHHQGNMLPSNLLSDLGVYDPLVAARNDVRQRQILESILLQNELLGRSGIPPNLAMPGGSPPESLAPVSAALLGGQHQEADLQTVFATTIANSNNQQTDTSLAQSADLRASVLGGAQVFRLPGVDAESTTPDGSNGGEASMKKRKSLT